MSEKKILVVDDSPPILTYLKNVLTKHLSREYRVISAKDGEEAWHLIREEKPDMIISDVEMPKINGLELCKLVKNDDLLKDVPLILLTSRDEIKDKVKGLNIGADDYVTKPFHYDEIIARINALMRMKSLQEKLKVKNQELEVAYQKIDEELKTIGFLQQSLLPKDYSHRERLEIAAFYAACSRAGGDYYDFIPIGEHHLGLVIADVSGHGSPAAVIMAVTRTILQYCTNNELSPARVLSVANDILLKSIFTEHYVTMFYGILDTQNMLLRYASAAHNPPVLCHQGNIVHLTVEEGMFLGIFDMPVTYQEKKISLSSGDKLILHTDGIVEAMNQNEEEFGNERLDKIIKQGGKLSASQLSGKIIAAAKDFTGNAPFEDDVTLVVVNFL